MSQDDPCKYQNLFLKHLSAQFDAGWKGGKGINIYVRVVHTRNQFRFIAMKKPLALFKRSASVKRLKRIPKVSDKFAQGNTSFADSN